MKRMNIRKTLSGAALIGAMIVGNNRTGRPAARRLRSRLRNGSWYDGQLRPGLRLLWVPA